MIRNSNIYFLYRVHPAEELHYQLLGKFILTPDFFEVIEDHKSGLLNFRGRSPEYIAQKIYALAHHSMYFKVVNLQDLLDGKHQELIQTYHAPEDTSPDSIFEYHRVGMPSAQILEFVEGKGYLDGHALSDQDMQLMLDNVNNGNATLQYKKESQSPESREYAFMSMRKVEPHLANALAAVRENVKSGKMDPSVLKALTGEIFSDSMIRSMGNKKAYEDFLSRPKKGVHVNLDLNDFGSINKVHSFETGNHAIKAAGKAIREAMDEAVGRKNGKLFRIGGDEFAAHIPNMEQAALFARTLRNKFEQIPDIKGTHKISASIGFGHNPQAADLAVIQAKQAKKAGQHPIGQSKTYAHSLMPGSEGAIPTGPDQEHLKIMQTPAPTTPQAPSAAPSPSVPDKP